MEVFTVKKNEFYILNSLYNGSIGRADCSYALDCVRALSDTRAYNRLVHAGYIDKESGCLTELGIKALEPYKVNNAVILAAGSSTRFIPLSLEQPKGLFEVRGEKLIERQIEQLQNAGIKNITIVLGYKKEMFFYLEDKYGVKFIINDSFNIKNNIESLYLAKEELKNTYICVSDSYYIENPFNQYEYITYYSGYRGNLITEEIYADVDSDGKIVCMDNKPVDNGYILMGHSFWKKEFSDSFINVMEDIRDDGKYNNSY